jgi:hypothetical protein
VRDSFARRRLADLATAVGVWFTTDHAMQKGNYGLTWKTKYLEERLADLEDQVDVLKKYLGVTLELHEPPVSKWWVKKL